MFKTAACIVALAAGVALSTPATAQTFTPPNEPVIILSGAVTIHQGSTFTCNFNIRLSTTSSYATIHSRTITGGFPCGSLIPPYGAWTLASGPGSNVTMTFGVNTPLNMPCFGTLVLPIAAGTITLPGGSSVLPPVTPGHLNCTVTSLTLNSTPTLGV